MIEALERRLTEIEPEIQRLRDLQTEASRINNAIAALKGVEFR